MYKPKRCSLLPHRAVCFPCMILGVWWGDSVSPLKLPKQNTKTKTPFVHSFYKYLLSTYYVTGTWNTSMNIYISFLSWSLYSRPGGWPDFSVKDQRVHSFIFVCPIYSVTTTQLCFEVSKESQNSGHGRVPIKLYLQ